LLTSYLAKARGSNEPATSIARVQDLDKFIREAEAFIIDHGNESGAAYDKRLEGFRNNFEELLGNSDHR